MNKYFEDDESVSLDCGCIAEPGMDYNEYFFEVGDHKRRRTCCECAECKADLLFNVLYEGKKAGVSVKMINVSDYHIRTAYERNMEYQDSMYEESL